MRPIRYEKKIERKPASRANKSRRERSCSYSSTTKCISPVSATADRTAKRKGGTEEVSIEGNEEKKEEVRKKVVSKQDGSLSFNSCTGTPENILRPGSYTLTAGNHTGETEGASDE